jgi:hypothetical protein
MQTIDSSLEKCLLLVAEKSGLGEMEHWTKRDFEQLGILIEQSTGIRLSASTLIRLYHQSFANRPQKSTLDALARFIGFAGWHEFSTGIDPSVPEPAPETISDPPNRMARILFLLVILLALFTVFASVKRLVRHKGIDPEKVTFRVVTPETTGLPATVQVAYDLGGNRPDSLWLQLNEDPESRMLLNPDGTKASAVYCYPGVFNCRLIADNHLIGIQRVYIKTSGWSVMIRHRENQPVPLYLNKSRLIHDGGLQVREEQVNPVNLERNSPVLTSYYFVNDLGPLQSTDYFVTAKVINPPTQLGTQPCGYCTLYVICGEGNHYFTLGDLGCSGFFKLDFNNGGPKDEKYNPTNFEYLMDDWMDFKLTVRDHKVEIFAGSSRIFQSENLADLGIVRGVHFLFSGLGGVRDVQLGNSLGAVAIREEN